MVVVWAGWTLAVLLAGVVFWAALTFAREGAWRALLMDPLAANGSRYGLTWAEQGLNVTIRVAAG
ncbi:MAG: hypothetical protein DRI34_08060 [Deltaproteobacteria bacterium]|nr:MAG: hypothetical protein DRI34_08060 [Deltaproteobacteria bacterium]